MKKIAQKYINKRATAVIPITNVISVEILDIIYGIEDEVIYRLRSNTKHDEYGTAIIEYDEQTNFNMFYVGELQLCLNDAITC